MRRPLSPAFCDGDHRILPDQSPETSWLITPQLSGKPDTKNIEFLNFVMPVICLLPSALSELFYQISHTGEITLADQYGLMAALLHPALALEERQALDRILYAFRRGRFQLTSQLSALS